MGKNLMERLVLAIVPLLSSFSLSSWARTHAMLLNPYTNSAVTKSYGYFILWLLLLEFSIDEEEEQSVFIQESRCPGFLTPLRPKESIVVQKLFSGTAGKTRISVSNTCAICSANQIILDYSSVLPPDLLFPYCGVNDAKHYAFP